MHVGPTNSGKTHAALQRLMEAKSGIYCGPLRLLAWEVADKMNSQGTPCNLVTGQEKRNVAGASHCSLTVEMADVSRPYQCAVIDEIQMIGNRDRGSAFTRALLGLAADEIHVCGDPAVMQLVERLIQTTEDSIQVKEYKRLSPLTPLSRAVGDLARVKAGDCVVAFSRRDIFAIKAEIEQSSRHRCCVVYGSLPSESRTRQAELFNSSSSGFNVLVASDAVGMGLNLNVKRIVFYTLQKFDGCRMRALTSAEIKQIAGRAGRFGSKYPEGQVTCLHQSDIPWLLSALSSPPQHVEAAALFPTFDQLALYSSLHPAKNFTQIIMEFTAIARMSPLYFMRECEDMLKVSSLLEQVPLSLSDRYLFCQSPVQTEDSSCMSALLKYAREYSMTGKVHFSKRMVPGRIRVPRNSREMVEIESYCKVAELYIWLGGRWENVFVDMSAALLEKELCSMTINAALSIR